MHPLPQDSQLAPNNPGENFPRPAPESLRDIFVRYSRPVLSFIYSMLRDRSQAEELCQETFVRALRKLDSRDPHTAPSAWIFGIAHNVVREAVKHKYRKFRHAAPYDQLTEDIDSGAVPADQQLLSAELGNRIHQALGKLTGDQRLVFVLKLIHKLKYEEIAYITGASTSKLKTDLHRARAEMRQNLQSYLHGGNSRI